MDNIDLWFPTVIGTSTNLLNDKLYIKSLIDKCYDIKTKYPKSNTGWLTSTYNTMNSYNICDDILFKELVYKVTNKVQDFVKNFNSSLTMVTRSAWLNIYNKTNYQEFHIHPGNLISCVYFLKCPEGSSGLSFVPQVRSSIDLDSIVQNNLTYDSASYEAVEDSLILFKSDIPHMVPQGTNVEDRISIALNFIGKDNATDT